MEKVGPGLPSGELRLSLPQALLGCCSACQSLLSVRSLHGTGMLPWLPLGPPLDISWGLHGCLLNGGEACSTSVFLVSVLSLSRLGGCVFCLLLLCLPLMAIAYC